MSLGIAFRARLREPQVLPELIEFVEGQAAVRGWRIVEAPGLVLDRARLRTLEGATLPSRDLRLAGAWLNPHFGADDVCLVFDATSGELCDASRATRSGAAAGADGPEVLGFSLVRTTYADAMTHVAIAELFETLAHRDLASVDMGDPEGEELPRDVEAAERRLRAARVRDFEAALERPDEPVRLQGVAEFLSPAETRRRSARPPGPVDLLPVAERDALLRSRDHLVETWGAEVPALDGEPDLAVSALERLTELLLAHPRLRNDPETLERTAWESGVALGFTLIEALGGHWERVEAPSGPYLRVANLGDTGLVWRPLDSAAERLRLGPIYAHDIVLGWLRSMAEVAGDVYRRAS